MPCRPATLPPRQLAAATAVRDYRRRHGYGPTLRELGELLGVSRVAAWALVRKLTTRGVVGVQPGWRVGHVLREDLLPPVRRLVFPILGTIS